MEALLFAVNAVAPIVLAIALGYFLKRIGWIGPSFAATANKLVFRVFLPAMLFLNVYKIDSIGDMNFNYILYAVVATFVLFAISVPAVKIVAHNREQCGVLLQGTFRSNYALIGIPLAQSLFGDEGVAVASLLSAVIIPLFNILAVISLSMFRAADTKKPQLCHVFGDILRNPLIQSIAAGLVALAIRDVFVQQGVAFRLTDLAPLYSLLKSLSGVATPLALLVLGAQFEFSAIKELKREIVFGTLMRTVAVPILGIGTAVIFFFEQFSGAHFAALVAMFATPVAVSSVPMAQEMDGDVSLAGQLVVWTTLTSAVTVFLVALLLRMAGIFI